MEQFTCASVLGFRLRIFDYLLVNFWKAVSEENKRKIKRYKSEAEDPKEQIHRVEEGELEPIEGLEEDPDLRSRMGLKTLD